MKLRYIAIVCICLSTIYSAWSQTHMYVLTVSGDVILYNLAELPVVTYTGTELHIQTTLNSSDKLPIKDIQYISYTTIPVRKSIKKVSYGPIDVYSVNGNYITTIQQAEDINSLPIPMGVYILKFSESSAKVIQR